MRVPTLAAVATLLCGHSVSGSKGIERFLREKNATQPGADPAEGWLGYAEAVNPSGQGIITFIEAYWVVPDDPLVGGAFFSPWFGIESSDNLNLIQPVNPWEGSYWAIYNEYYQWSPPHNQDSRSHVVKAGDVLYGSVTYNGDNQQSYTMFHKDLNDGWSVSTTIDIQKDSNTGKPKEYTIAYFVFEKEYYNCAMYPPNNQVTFYDIRIEYDGKVVSPQWNTS